MDVKHGCDSFLQHVANACVSPDAAQTESPERAPVRSKVWVLLAHAAHSNNMLLVVAMQRGHPRSFAGITGSRFEGHKAMAIGLFAWICVGCCRSVLAEQGGVLNVIVEGPEASATSKLSKEFAAVRREAASLRSGISKPSRIASQQGKPSNAKVAAGFVAAGKADVVSLPGLVEQVDAGGSTALRALQELCALAVEPASRAAVLHSGAVRAAEALLKRPSSEESVRAAAGGLLSLLSNMPVASSVADPQTGGAASVDIVMPRPSRVYAAGVASFLSTKNKASGMPSEYERETQAPMIWINVHDSANAIS